MKLRDAALLATIAVVACKKDDDQDPPQSEVQAALAEDGADTNDAEKDAESLVASLVPDPGAMGDVGDPAARLFLPRQCATVTQDRDAKTVTVRFDGCTGPRGLFNVRGEVKATYGAPSPNELTLDVSATNLAINGATVDWTARAAVTTAGLARTMTWRAQLSGQTRKGRPFTRTNDKRISWTVGQPCIAFEGASEGDVSSRTLRTEVTALSVCRAACPDAGGKIAVTDLDNGTRIEIRFDGTQEATFVAPDGREVRFRLICRP